MNADVLQFFESHIDALPIYEALENAVWRDIQPVEVRVQKTQISFYNRRMFACASFLPARKKKDRPDTWLTVTFGLDHPVRSPRVDVVTEAQPNRWTHHVLISAPKEIDGELLGWIKEAAEFSAGKR